MTYRTESEAQTFEATEEKWFSEPPPARRPSQRPTRPAPPSPSTPPSIDDSIADGWFFDV